LPSLFTTFLAAAAGRAGAFKNAEDLVLTHDEKLFAIDLDFRAAVFSEKNAIALFDVEGLAGAVVLIFAFADCDYFAFLGFFLGVSGMMMPPRTCSPSSIRFTMTRS